MSATEKPGFSRAGYLHRIAMSYKTSLFVIVEGIDHDPYLVDKICRSSARIRAAGYEIRHIRQIRQASGQASGGKAAVLGFYDYCRRFKKLKQKNNRGARSICFFVDRDGQQITGGMRTSSHVIYTRLADSEAHIFSDSDETESLAAAASLDRQTAENLIAYLGDWKRELADSWRPWIEECYVAEAVRSRCWVGFGAAQSEVHTKPGYRILDEMALERARKDVKSTSLLDEAKYGAVREKILRKIDAVYNAGMQSSLLKGKWLPAQLAYEVANYFDALEMSDGWNRQNFRPSIISCYLSNLNTSTKNISELRKSFELLLAS